MACTYNDGWRRFAIDIGVGMGIVLLCAAISLSFHVWLNNQDLQRMEDHAGPVLQLQRSAASQASASLGTAQYLSVIKERISALREQEGRSSVKEKSSGLADFLLSFGMLSSHGRNILEKEAHWASERENLSEKMVVKE